MARKRHYAYTVCWRDSASLRGWQDLYHPDHGVAEITSVGWCTRLTGKEITLTNSISQTGKVNDALTIPREAVIKLRRLKQFIEGDE